METVMKRRSLLALPTAVAAVLAGTQFAGAALIYGKAWLAPVLIERAWGESRASGQAVKPWSWADTWPVARLGVERLGIERFVMHGDNGNAMAFGPGLAAGARPGSPGLPMISTQSISRLNSASNSSRPIVPGEPTGC